MVKRLSCIVFVYAAFVAVHGFPNQQFFGDAQGFVPENPNTDDSNSKKIGVVVNIFEGRIPAPSDSNAFGLDHSEANILNAMGDIFVSKICGNQTLAQGFLTDMRQSIDTLQSNGSFTNVLADAAQQVAYIQSSTSAALITSNCPEFFHGLKNAKDADRDALMEKFQYYRIAINAVMRTIQNLVRRNH